MSTLPSNFEQHLGFVMGDVTRLMRRQFDRRVKDLHLTRAQWLFLFHLARRPGCTQSDLAERLQVERISVSRQAERLAKAGWIERLDDATDARAYRLTLRPKAERVVAQLSRLANELREESFAGIPVSRREALVQDLLQVKSNLLRLEAEAHS